MNSTKAVVAEAARTRAPNYHRVELLGDHGLRSIGANPWARMVEKGGIVDPLGWRGHGVAEPDVELDL
jgi:hypothetical protein